MIEKTVFQDKKYFTLGVTVNLQDDDGEEKKSDIFHENQFSLTKRMFQKVIVSAAISWYGVTKPFFINKNGVKINRGNYCQHFLKKLFSTIEIAVKRDDWIFAQDKALFHQSHLVQGFLRNNLKRGSIRAEEWLLSSPDISQLDYFYFGFVKFKVYEGRCAKPFASEICLEYLCR